jgi:hypothetical protein
VLAQLLHGTERGNPAYSFGVWPRFHPQDSVRIRTSGRVGEVNQIGPNERGDDWFEIAFEPDAQAVPGPGLLIADADVATYRADELELVEASGLKHDEEIELALEVSDSDAEAIAHQLQRLIAETFPSSEREGSTPGICASGHSTRSSSRGGTRAHGTARIGMARRGRRLVREPDVGGRVPRCRRPRGSDLSPPLARPEAGRASSGRARGLEPPVARRRSGLLIHATQRGGPDERCQARARWHRRLRAILLL